MAEGKAGFNASLGIHHVSPSRNIDAIHDAPPEVRDWLKSIGQDAETFLRRMPTHLWAHHYRPDPLGDFVGHHPDQGPPPAFRPHVIVQDPDLHGQRHVLVGEHYLGSGLITNAGVAMLTFDFTPWTAGATFKQQNFHGLGTGATAAALSDVVIQTQVAAASLTGSTNGFMTGTQTFVLPTTAVPHPIYQTVATFTALAASTAVTEWGLFMSNILPLNIPGSGTTYTATGAAFSAITAPLVGGSVLNVATAVNTTTSTLLGLVTASSTTTLTTPGWNTMLHATGSTPAGASASQVVPTMWDHKVFGALTLVTSDTLAMTYQAQTTSGG